VVVLLGICLVGRAARAGSGGPDDSSAGAPAKGNPSAAADNAGSGDAPGTQTATAPAGGAVVVPDPVQEAARIEAASEPPVSDHRIASGLALGGIYTGLATWAYFAWYYNRPNLPAFKFGGDGWLGPNTYAGGADKFGHFWANLTFSRLGTDLLRAGGWGKLSSSLIASGLSLSFFFFVEVKDGYYYEFSPSDMTGNTLGALLAVAMSNWPALDDAIDFRVQWFPSKQFRRQLSVNFVEDYSGETYLLAFKPRSIRAIREGDWSVRWLEFVNPVIGYETRGYKPAPLPEDMEVRHQNLFFGVTVDMQAVVDETLGRSSSHGARVAASILHTGFEFGNLPFTTIHGGTRSPDEL
jgi:Predicted periplasmic lipoprotein (DUF2279)